MTGGIIGDFSLIIHEHKIKHERKMPHVFLLINVCNQ